MVFTIICNEKGEKRKKTLSPLFFSYASINENQLWTSLVVIAAGRPSHFVRSFFFSLLIRFVFYIIDLHFQYMYFVVVVVYKRKFDCISMYEQSVPFAFRTKSNNNHKKNQKEAKKTLWLLRMNAGCLIFFSSVCISYLLCCTTNVLGAIFLIIFNIITSLWFVLRLINTEFEWFKCFYILDLNLFNHNKFDISVDNYYCLGFLMINTFRFLNSLLDLQWSALPLMRQRQQRKNATTI